MVFGAILGGLCYLPHCGVLAPITPTTSLTFDIYKYFRLASGKQAIFAPFSMRVLHGLSMRRGYAQDLTWFV